jgi:hypothetical protein
MKWNAFCHGQGHHKQLGRPIRSSGDKKIYLLVFRMEVFYSCFLTFPQNFASLGDRQYTKDFGTAVYKVKSYAHRTTLRNITAIQGVELM